MAIVKITPIHSTLNKALSYITRQNKTNGGMYITTYCCSQNTKNASLEFDMIRKKSKKNRRNETIARHIIQSFSPSDNITPEIAHRIGKTFCDRALNNEYQYYLVTHLDKNQIHNHIIFNTTNMKTFKKYRSNKKTYHELQRISDELCYENNISTIKKRISKQRGKSYKEWTEYKKGTSYKEQLKKDIDKCVEQSISYDDFKSQMKSLGYEIKDYNKDGNFLKYISFKNTKYGMQRFIRGRDTLLGERYTRENIQLRIKRHSISINDHKEKNSMKKIIGPDNRKAKTIIGYRKFSAKHNIKTYAETKAFMKQHNLISYEDLSSFNSNINKEVSKLTNKINNLENKLNKINIFINTYEQYNSTKEIYITYKNLNTNDKKKFFKKYKNQLYEYKDAVKTLKDLSQQKELPPIDKILKEKEKTTTLLEKNLLKLKEKQEIKEQAEIALSNMAKILDKGRDID